MKFRAIWVVTLSATVGLGCAKVDTSEGSNENEPAVPTIETGDKAPDLDLQTDDDVDIDTPASGDS